MSITIAFAGSKLSQVFEHARTDSSTISGTGKMTAKGIMYGFYPATFLLVDLTMKDISESKLWMQLLQSLCHRDGGRQICIRAGACTANGKGSVRT